VSPSPAFVTADEVMRELHRVADRLRVVGPRLAARSQQDDAVTVIGRARETLQQLADLASDGTHRKVPDLAPYALGDQALVLGQDVLRAARAAREAGDDDKATSLLAQANATLESLRKAL
jgi:hypothetical protein